MSNEKYNYTAMAKFTKLLKCDPDKAYDFISCNYLSFSRDELLDIIKELLYSINYHTNDRFYGDLYTNIMEDVAIELNDRYDDLYEEAYV